MENMTKSVHKRLAVQIPQCKKCGGQMQPGKAIQKTLDANKHLADGENCTLIELKRAIGAA